MPPKKRKTQTVGGRAGVKPAERGAKQRFNPDAPFAEGVRGPDSFYIQDGLLFDRASRCLKGTLDG
ncbi:MAG: hypothetical protein JRJ59_12300 [Deltaproteobacteria bacterium]|nr:hypothetical protein [Deltaproteobacteria bacterium]